MTGRIVRKLTSTATDPHTSSIEFIYSAGTWDGQSRRLPIATIASGRPALAIYDGTSGRKEREISVRGVDQILNPGWAPDGHAIAFSGLSQGLSDLYLYDLRASSLQRLTNDAFAEVHPSWSPDSRTIAFATDRFTTNLDTLAIGRYELATIHPASGRVQRVKPFAGADSINPQWSRDGRELYFVANPSGIADVYGVSVATGALTQLTNVSTGTSGITASSPALSVAYGRDEAASASTTTTSTTSTPSTWQQAPRLRSGQAPRLRSGQAPRLRSGQAARRCNAMSPMPPPCHPQRGRKAMSPSSLPTRSSVCRRGSRRDRARSPTTRPRSRSRGSASRRSPSA